MRSASLLTLSLASLLACAPAAHAQDLSRYREFHLGMSLEAVAHQAGIGSEPQVVHTRPQLIQELMWQPPSGSSTSVRDSARKVLFGFYNGQLFRIAIDYDRDKTEGLTDQDMTAAISTKYGTALLTAMHIGPPSTEIGRDRNVVVARWEDLTYAAVLTRPWYSSAFTLVISARGPEALATVASAESVRLDAKEAPQRELDRQRKQDDENRAKDEKARRANIGTFRP
jgi:hypothetical protein